MLLIIYGWSASSLRPNRAWAGGGCPTVTLTWQASASQLKSFGFSDTGRYFYTIDNKGTASIYSTSGTKLLSMDVSGANKIVVAPGGKYILAYSHLNPIDSTLVFFDSQGKKLWDMEVDGAVWSADVCTNDDGACFTVGTGDKYIYVINIAGANRKYRRWKAPGVVVSLNVDPKANYLTMGTWQDSTITRCALTGKRLWTVSTSSSELQYVADILASDRVLVHSTPNNRGSDGTFTLMDNKGRKIWSGKIKSSEKTKLLYSPSGRYVCLGYDKSISHKGETTSEKHAALFDSKGRRLWDKGSLIFHPQPLAVTSEGCVVLVTEKNAVFTMNRDGELNPSVKLPSTVVSSVAAPDGSAVLLKCADGKLHMLRFIR